MKEVSWRVSSIYARHNRSIEVTAAMHGVQLKDKQKPEATEELTSLQQEAMDKAIESRLKGKHHGR